jgi:hypothetical protein
MGLATCPHTQGRARHKVLGSCAHISCTLDGNDRPQGSCEVVSCALPLATHGYLMYTH